MGRKQAIKPKLLYTTPTVETPIISIHPSKTIILCFENSLSMSTLLGRPHVAYEGNELKGPLKGVNFPISHLKQWVQEVGVENLTDMESLIFSYLQPDTQYLIAHLKNDKSTLLHEWAHALFHNSSEYQSKVSDYWHSLPLSIQTAIQKELTLRNYSPSVTIDEFQAYIAETPAEFGKKYIDLLKPIHAFCRRQVELFIHGQG